MVDESTILRFQRFLENIPPLETWRCEVSVVDAGFGSGVAEIGLPSIKLHCSSEECGDARYFDPSTKEIRVYKQTDCVQFFNLVYRCRNCYSVEKTYAIRLQVDDKFPEKARVSVIKIGEEPRFGAPLPQVIVNLLDDQVEYFRRGYHAELEGLGIGAFSYYRRYVESHKNQIIQAIRDVAVEQGADAIMLEGFDKALNATQFEASIREIKNGIPDSFRLQGGHNPLTLLHDALSNGMHSDDDQACLQLAADIRGLLTDLSERVDNALKNREKLKDSVDRLLRYKTEKSKPKPV